MSGFDAGTFGGGIGNAASVSVDAYTAAYRVSGTIETRFSRITEILNQLSGAHLEVKRATISEYDDASATHARLGHRPERGGGCRLSHLAASASRPAGG